VSDHSGETKPTVARHLNQVGAEIRITEVDPVLGAGQYKWGCTGCGDNSGMYYGPMPFTRQRANEHANACRALPPENAKDTP
jgi:hypothetical protein